MSMKLISICLSDIPKEKMKKANNGKVYVNIIVADRKEKDQYENDCYVAVAQTKEEREAQQSKIYIGNGKTVEFNQTSAPINPSAVDDLPPADCNGGCDDLPF